MWVAKVLHEMENLVGVGCLGLDPNSSCVFKLKLRCCLLWARCSLICVEFSLCVMAPVQVGAAWQ